MSGTHGMPALSDDDFDAIAEAVAETARGRWFLAEYARRNRNADTEMLLDAIHRLAGGSGSDRQLAQIERVRSDLLDMAKTIVRLKAELAAEGANSRFAEAKGALDDVVKTTEAATSSILEATEQIQEMAWTLREAGADAAVCDLLDRRAGDIYTACTFQDLTAQQTQKVVRTLRYLEGRLNGLIDAWSQDRSGDAMPSPAIEPEIMEATATAPADPGLQPVIPAKAASLSQDDVDVVIIDHDDGDEPHWLDDEPVAAAEAESDPHSAGDIAFMAAGDATMTVPSTILAMPPAEPEPAPETVGTHQHAVAVEPATDEAMTLSAIDRLPTTAKLSLFG